MIRARQGPISPNREGGIDVAAKTGRADAAGAPVQTLDAMHIAQSTLGNQGVLRRMESGLRINDVNDPAEREADRVASAVLSEGEEAREQTVTPTSGPVVQRKCGCGNLVQGTECPECRKKKTLQLQPKLRVNKPGDSYEQEADHIAEQVICPRQQSEQLQIRPITPLVQRDAEGGHHAPASSRIADRTLSSTGQPLHPAVRAYFEPRFGRNFSQVRVHTDKKAVESAHALDALAYTVGNDIVFNTGRYAPESTLGRRLLAHELTHVVQQQGGAHQIQRDTNPGRSAPAQSVNPFTALLAQVAPEVSKQFSVRAFKESEFEALTGIKASSIPEKRLLSPAEAGLEAETSGGASAGTAAGALFAPRPTLPRPLGSKGILWSADAHLSQYAVVRQNNPLIAFFFGDSSLEVYGFRANAVLHFGAAGERIFDTAGGTRTARLNLGAPGTYYDDWFYPYLPVKGGSVAIDSGAENLPGAEALVNCMKSLKRSGLKRLYTFSTPDRTSPAYDRAFGKGAAANPEHKPPEIINCLNEANATNLTRQALDGSDLIDSLNGRDFYVSSATYVDTGESVPGMLPGAAKSARQYLKQWDTNPLARGYMRTPMTGGTILRGVTGVVRIGGFVLMIVNVFRVEDRYERATEYEKPVVLGEEGTLLTAGLLGSLLGEVIGEAVLCVGTGPGFGLCVLAAGVLGGVVGSSLSEGAAHDLGRVLQDAAELNRQGKLLPGVVEAAVQVLGSDQQKKFFQDFKKAERPEPSDGWFDFHF